MQWLAQVQRTGNGDAERSALSQDDQRSEMLLMGMRLHEGVRLDRMNINSDDVFTSNIKRLADLDMVKSVDGRLVLTSKGRPVLNAVLREMLAD
jgi:oxygen-independent coproporphyrinogen-3 oxidase